MSRVGEGLGEGSKIDCSDSKAYSSIQLFSINLSRLLYISFICIIKIHHKNKIE